MEHVKDSRVLDRLPTIVGRWRYAGLLAVLMVAMAIVLGPSSLPVSAANFTVDSIDDTIDISPGDGVCQDGSEALACSLRAAIMEANALAGADTITVPAGTFTLTIAGSGENASATGDLDITENVTITGAGSGSTIIDGGALDRVLQVQSGSVTLSGLTLQNGLAPTVEGGGGVYIVDAALVTATDVIIQNNDVVPSEGAPAGGIFVDGTLDLSNSQVLSNTAQFGGGIYNLGTLVIDQTTVQGNADDDAYGGAGGILNNGGDMTVTRSAIISNINGGLNSSGTAELINTTVKELEVTQ